MKKYLLFFIDNVKKIFELAKDQIKLKADWSAIDSPKQRTNKFVLFAFFAFHSKQSKFVRSFIFGRIFGAPKLLSVLSDLYSNKFIEIPVKYRIFNRKEKK